MAEKCPAGKVNCEHYKEIDGNEVVGKCFANRKMAVARDILKQDTQCPCRQLQKIVESRFENAWNIYKHGQRFPRVFVEKDEFFRALIEAGLKDD